MHAGFPTPVSSPTPPLGIKKQMPSRNSNALGLPCNLFESLSYEPLYKSKGVETGVGQDYHLNALAD